MRTCIGSMNAPFGWTAVVRGGGKSVIYENTLLGWQPPVGRILQGEYLTQVGGPFISTHHPGHSPMATEQI